MSDDSRAPIAESAGIDTRFARRHRDPFEAFDALMELVEALLPGGPRVLRKEVTRGTFLL